MKKVKRDSINIKRWIKERIILVSVVIFTFGTIIYVGVSFFPHTVWLAPLKEFATILAFVGIVSLLYELFLREFTFEEYKMALEEVINPDAVRLGIKSIFKDRGELSRAISAEYLFRDAREEIYFGGSTLLSVSTAFREILKEKALQGINIRLLLLDPSSDIVSLIIKQQATNQVSFRNEIQTAIILLKKLKQEIEAETGFPERGSIIIHTTGRIPTHSFVAIDSHLPGGMIQADLHPYLGENLSRPSFYLLNKEDGLFQHIRRINEGNWKNSQPLPTERDAGAEVKTLVLVSGREDYFYDSVENTWRPALPCTISSQWLGIKGALWVWRKELITLEETRSGCRETMRRSFDLPAAEEINISEANLYLRANSTCSFEINNKEYPEKFGGSDLPQPYMIDIVPYLVKGKNELRIKTTIFAKPMAQSEEENLPGVIYRLKLTYRTKLSE